MAEAIEKVARALDLVPFVLKNQGISFSDLAGKFGIAEKELYEELNIIFCCGLPGYTPLELIDLSFEDGFVSVINPQVLNVARKLSGTELLRLHLGLQFLIPFLSEELSQSAISLSHRISALLNDVTPYAAIGPENRDLIDFFRQAISQNHLVEFQYISANSDSKSVRIIEPYNLRQSSNHLLLEGFEREKKQFKTFRADRVQNWKKIGTFEKSTLKNEIENSEEFIVEVFKDAEKFISDNSNFVSNIDTKSNSKIVSIQGISRTWLISEVFAFSGSIRVLQPESLKVSIQNEAKRRILLQE